MPGHAMRSSEKRRGPSERSCTSSAVHFAPTISAHAATEQDVVSCTAFIVRTTSIVCSALRDVPQPPAGDVVDEPDRGVRVGEERRLADPTQARAYALVEIAKVKEVDL